MRANFKVVLDACVLANFGVCDLLLRLAEPPRLYLPVWSARILEETHRTQTTKLKKPWPEELADHFRKEVCDAFPSAMVTGHEVLESVLLNDPKDRHVLAAAIKSQATVIVTFNIRDFPCETLKPWDIETRHPQEFLVTLYSMAADVVMAKLIEIATERGKTPMELLSHLRKSVPSFVEHVATSMEWDIPN